MLVALIASRPIRAGEYVQAVKGGGVSPFRIQRRRPRTVRHRLSHNKQVWIIGTALTPGKYFGRIIIETVV